MKSRLLCSDSLYMDFRLDCMKGLSLVARTMATARIRVTAPKVRWFPKMKKLLKAKRPALALIR